MKRLIKIFVFLTLSLIIHLGVSQLFTGSTVSRQAYRQVHVSLVSQKAPEKPQIPEQPKPQPKPKPKPKPKPEPRPEPVPEPQEAPEEEIEPAPESVTPAEPVESVSAVDSRMAAEIYERQVLNIIRKNLRYPANARRRGIEGTVTVRFTILGSGEVSGVRIVRSSGANVLDKATLEAIGRCGFPPPPGGRVELSIPITFRLTEEM